MGVRARHFSRASTWRSRFPWSPREAIPAPDYRAVRALIADAKRLIAEDRASRLLRELGG